MPRVVLNARAVGKLAGPKPPADRVLWWDAAPGSPSMFGVRVSGDGRRVYVVGFRLAGRQRLMTIKSVGDISLSDAREAARDALGKASRGEDPFEVKRGPGGDSIAGLAEDFIASEEFQSLKRRRDDERTLRRSVVKEFGAKKPSELTRAEIRAWAERIKTRAPYMANASLSMLRRLLAWGVEHERVEHLPAFPRWQRKAQGRRKWGNAPTAAPSRDRYLTEDEIRAVWRAAEAEETRGNLAGSVVKLLLLTGARRNEVCSMKWADIAGSWWTIPTTKAGRSHRVWLTESAVAVLDRVRRDTGGGALVFPGRNGKPLQVNHAGVRIWKEARVEGARLHDLRRTCATYMSEAGVSRDAVRRILNHADGSVTGIYDRATHDAAKIAAWSAWEADLARILAGKEREAGSVVAFQPRSA